MKRSKQFIFVIVSLFLLSFAGAAVAQDAPVIPPQPCEAPGELTMWVWDEVWADVIGQSIAAWEESYCPGADVELVQQPWAQYWDLIQTNAAGGDLPDVFNMSQDRIGFYADNEALLNLQPYYDAAELDTLVWSPGFVDPYRSGENGDLHAGPVNWDTLAMFYNKDMFDAAGLDYPTADWTWDDFRNAAAALTDAEADVYGASVYAGYQTGYPNWIAATDTVPVVDAERTQCTLTEPGSIEALWFLKGMLDDGLMPSVSVQGGSGADDAFNYWLNGRVAMVAAGSWKIPQAMNDATFEWDIVQLPRHPETGITRPIVHSVGYVAAANTDNPDLAANLILYLVSDEGQQFFAEAGGVAPANPSLQDEWIASFGETDKNIQAFVDALEDTQGVTAFGEIWGAVDTDLVVNIFDLGMSVEDATQQACEFINSQLPE